MVQQVKNLVLSLLWLGLLPWSGQNKNKNPQKPIQTKYRKIS